MNTTVPGVTDSNLTYELVEITPALAKEWLQSNTHNRRLRPRVVNGYATDMTAGAWPEDGQSIKFSSAGVLLDGQHRLAAIIQSGVTLRLLVVSGLPDFTQDTMDTGAKRTLGDVLKLRGESNYIALASALMRIHQWEEGARRSIGRGNGGARPTHRQLLQLLETHPEIRRSAEIAVRVRNALPMPAGCTSLCHWLFNRIDGSDCAFFFARLADGAGLDAADAVYVLRRTIELNSRTRSRNSINEAYLIALVIKAWNSYREGRPMHHLQFRSGGANPEQFPEPK